MIKIREALVNLMRRIVDTGDKELIKKEKATLRFKALSVDKIFTDTSKNLNEFLEIADSLNTFQKNEIKQVKDVIKLIKRYHVVQLTEVEIATQALDSYINTKRTRRNKG